MRNISDFVNVHWFLGVPFNDTNWRLAIVETGQAILEEFLIGMQAGNEPDLYSTHGRRPAVSGVPLFLKRTIDCVAELQPGRLLQRIRLAHSGSRSR